MIRSFTGVTYFLSNFYPCDFEFDGIIYHTAEAAFQAQKTEDTEKRIDMSKIVSAASVKHVGRTLKLRDDWEEIKDDVMYRIVYAKFSTNESLKKRLLETGDEELIEGNTWNDTYWGVCKGVGLNKLGEILMRVREELK